MIMKYRIKFICFILFAFIALTECNKKTLRLSTLITTNIENINVDPKHGPFLPTDSMIESVSCVKLETSDDCLIGAVNQIIFRDSLMIIVDSKHANAIFVFDMKGNYKYKISKFGQGPEEYVSLTHVCLTPDGDKLSVYDLAQRKIIYFSINGEYKYAEKVPFYMRYFEFLESGNRVFNTEASRDGNLGGYKNNSAIVTDPEINIIYGSCRDFYSKHFTFMIQKPLHKFGKEVYYSPSYNDTIFEITDTVAVAKYAINILHDRAPRMTDETTSEMHEEYLRKKFMFIGGFIELKDLTFVQIHSPSGYPFLVYSHKNKRSYLNSGDCSDPLKAFLSNFHTPAGRYEDNVLVHDVDAYELLAAKEDFYNNSPKFKAVLDSLYDGLTEDSNPVLFFYKMRTDFEE
jgi:hypothetical protein